VVSTKTSRHRWAASLVETWGPKADDVDRVEARPTTSARPPRETTSAVVEHLALTTPNPWHHTETRKDHPMSTIKIYDLYPRWGGGFSVKTNDYDGTTFTVSATSIRQAFAVAYKRAWIDPASGHPVGVVSIYRRSTGTTLWCGCSGHDVTGGHVLPGAGVRALRTAIDAHDCPRRVPTLRERLQAAAAAAADASAVPNAVPNGGRS
jgi:hypothetical protein